MSTYESGNDLYVGEGFAANTVTGAGNVPHNIMSAKRVHNAITTSVDKGNHDIFIREARTVYATVKRVGIEGDDGETTTRERNSNSVAFWINRWLIPHTSFCVLKEKLQHMYKYVTLPKVAQVGGHDLPMGEYFVKLELNQSNESIEINEIFNPYNSKKSLRILIEGQPGHGKTTLATKLAFDWARNERYIKHFKLVFFFSLNQAPQITEAIEAVGKRCNCHDVSHIVNKHMKDTLFIFDGLDKVAMKDRAEIIQILYKQKYSDVSIVVFCKTHSFKLRKDECPQVCGLPTLSSNFYDKKINILGVQSVETKRQFWKKFFPETTVYDIIEHFSTQQLKLFDSPFLLMASPVIMADTGHLPTKAEFLKKSFDLILRYNCEKYDTNLFSLNSSANKIQEQIREFGMLAVHNVIQRKTKIKSVNVTKEMYKYGLLMKHKEMTLFKTESYYEALELSIIELAVAFTIWVDLKTNETQFMHNFAPFHFKPILDHFIETEGKSLAMPFLANLMQDDLDCLLTRIDSCGTQSALRFDLIIKLFSECSVIRISESMENFVSSQIYLSRYTICYFGHSLSLWRLSRPTLHYYIISFPLFEFMLTNLITNINLEIPT